MARAQQRDQAATELVRALLIVNAGGAGALLVFIQAVWKIDTSLVKPTVWALSFLCFGAMCAAAFHLLRYEASWYYQNNWLRGWRNLRRAYLGAAIAALLAFLVGVVVLAVGMLSILATGIKTATPEVSVNAAPGPPPATDQRGPNWELAATLTVPATVVVVGWWIVSFLTTRRDRDSKRREIRVQHLIEAYRQFANSSNRPFTEDVRGALESATTDIQLLGSARVVDLVDKWVEAYIARQPGVTSPLATALRDELREELRLECLPRPPKVLRIDVDEPKGEEPG